MIFVAKSSPEWTRVPRRVTDRLTVRRLVNINPGWPRTSSTVAPRKPQHHHLRSPRSESKSFFFLKQEYASSEPSRKWGREEVLPPLPSEPEEVPPPPPAEPEEVPLPPLEEVLPPTPAEVKPPPPEEVKWLKPPRRKVARQPVLPLRAPTVNVEDVVFSEDALPCFPESWKGGRSSRGPTID
jgi:hypothetical protein